MLYVNQSDDSVHRYYCINHVCSMFVIYKILNQNKTITSTVEVVAQVALSNINLYDDNPHARKKLRCQEYCKQTGADISIKNTEMRHKAGLIALYLNYQLILSTEVAVHSLFLHATIYRERNHS